MRTIDFVARTSAGNSQNGTIPSDKNVFVMDGGSGQEISLNLRQSDIRGYNREGRNLEIVLADGRVIILEGYFGADGSAASRLFISADGYLNEVTMVIANDGSLYAQYGPTEQWGKWSPTEDLIFLDGTEVAGTAADEDVSMLGAGLLGGSGLLGALGLGAAGVGAAAVVGGGDDGAGPAPDDRIEPTINEVGPIEVGGDDVDPATESVTITGTAEPGSNVDVTLGEHTVSTTADDDGTWSVVFEGENFPADGTHTVTAVVTEPDGTTTTVDGPRIVVDTTPPDTAVTEGTVSTGEIVNAQEHEDGVQISGTGEAGADLVVTISGATHATFTATTTVGADGTWTVNFPDMPGGEYMSDVTVVSTDAFGNSTTVTDQVQIDTIPHPLTIDDGAIGGEGTINFAENAAGFAVTGTSTTGATVTVTLEGVTQQAIVGSDGTWTVNFDAGTMPGGQYDATVTATTVDLAGNSTTASGTFHVDTEVRDFTMQAAPGGADGVINAAEAPDGFTVTGTAEPGSAIVIEMNGATLNTTADADGNWSASFSGSQIQPGTYTATMVVTTTDIAGNSDSLSQSVSVDTEAGLLTLNAGAIGGDGTINAAEAAAGVPVSGTADPGATVIVTLDGVEHTTTADGNGNWTTTYTKAEITPGTHTPVVTASTVDAAGNPTSVQGTVHVDTEVLNLSQDPYDLATTTSGADVINNTVATAGFELTGTVEPGSVVMVTVGTVTSQAVVDANGNWTAGFAPGAIGTGEGLLDVTVAVEDKAGNTQTLSDTIALDTLVNSLSQSATPIEGDNIVNRAEAADGVQITGQVEPGSTVQLQAFGQSYAAVVAVNGSWTVSIPGTDIPAQQGAVNMVIAATDSAGNTDSITSQMTIDLVAPDQPDLIGGFRQTGGGYRSVTIETSDDTVTIHQVDGGGNVTQMALHASEDAFLGETDYFFLDGAGAPQAIPDGSELIITNTDDAGNASSTYVVLDETATTSVNVGSINLTGFNIDAIDLGLGDQRELTLTEQQLKDLSQNGDQLIVHGGADDTVTIAGAQAAGTTTIDGETFNVYTLGTDGATIIIDDDITNVNI